jgi:hypothetical protein
MSWYNVSRKQEIMSMESLKSGLSAKHKAHFTSGGTPKMWYGAAMRLDESHSKAQKSKYACRRWKEEQ